MSLDSATATSPLITTEWALHGRTPTDKDGYRVLACSDGRLSRGNFTELIDRFTPGTLPAGWSTFMIGGGDLVGIEHRDIKKVPRFLQSLAQTNIVMTNPARCIWDLRSSRETAELPIRTQWVLPGVDAPYAWTISPTGVFVAEGGTALVTIYRVAGM